MRHWAIRLITYPLLFVLALIFIGPTIPIDVSIIIITGVVAMLGLSSEPHSASAVRSYIAAWRRIIAARLKL